jgi:RHS repeat-associated protein
LNSKIEKLALGLLVAATIASGCTASTDGSIASALGVVDAGVDLQASGTTLPESSAAKAVVDAIRARYLVDYPPKPEDLHNSKSPPKRGPRLGSSEISGLIASSVDLEPQFISKKATRTAFPTISLPLSADGPIQLADPDEGMKIEITLVDSVLTRGEYAEGFAVYRSAHKSGAHIIHRIMQGGIEDYFSFDTAPARPVIEYDVRLISSVAGLRLVGGALEFLSASGAPHFRVTQPYIVDHTGFLETASMEVSGCSYDTNGNPPWDRSVVAPGSSMCRVRIAWDPSPLHYPALLDPNWTTGHQLVYPRFRHTATAFNGKILIAGGFQGSGVPLSVSELYDPVSDTSATTPSMSLPRGYASATYLPSINGVLIAGGYTQSGYTAATPRSEIYQLSGGQWTYVSMTSQMHAARAEHVAVALPSGQVMTCGGYSTAGLASCERYDPATNSWASTPPAAMHSPRELPAVSLIDSGNRVLVTGGWLSNNAEFYTVSSDSWQVTPNMANYRYCHSQATLPDGRVIVVGGYDTNLAAETNQFQVYTFSPSAPFGSWSTSASFSTVRRREFAGGLTANGTFVLAGGYNGSNAASETDIYDPQAGTWHTGPAIPTPVWAARTTAITKNSTPLLVVTGGYNFITYTQAAIQYLTMDGACVADADCETGQCLSGQCSSAQCTSSSQCVSGEFCGSGRCQPKFQGGTACGTNGSVCASGNCVNNVCCYTSSCSACARCDISTIGVCGPVPAGTPGSPACSGNTVCDGSSQLCGGICTQDSQCAADSYCVPGTGCTTKKPTSPASTCTAANQCASGFCAQGYCCNTACDNGTSCEACNLTASRGTCTIVTTGSCAALQLPPDPTAVMTLPPPGVATSFVDSTVFLYTQQNQANLIQKGPINTTSVLFPDRAAVVRGRVLAQGLSLPGATISILSHPEYGTTISRTDGRYDMAVNGGTILTVVIKAQSFVTVERQVSVAANAYTAVPDVSMMLYSTSTTSVNLSDGNSHYIIGPAVVENGNTRHTNLLFLSGTTATITFADGTTQPTTTLSVHSPLEMTQTTDDSAMAGTLPPTSAYTFAADFAVEEVLSRQSPPACTTNSDCPTGQTCLNGYCPIASGVSFPGTLPIAYVDNFLNFPVGTTAPLGGFDPTTGTWQAAASGTVINVCRISGGAAQVDTTNGGCTTPDNGVGLVPPMLLTERQQLALMYPSPPMGGQKLWRVQLPHFSDWDVNWGIYPPVAAVYPNVPPASVPYKKDDPCTAEGSIIECDNQILGQRLPIAGTSFTLNYRTDRQPGWASDRTISVPLVGATVPTGLAQVWLKVSVAGRNFMIPYAPSANLTATFTWDGNDPYGRPITGPALATVQVGYGYQATYANTTKFGYNGGGTISAAPNMRQQLVLWSGLMTVTLRQWDARTIGLGGWTLDVHHVLDLSTGTLYRGDGSRTSGAAIPPTITTVAGGVPAGLGVDGPAVGSAFSNPVGVAVVPDSAMSTGGTAIYVADKGNGRIRKVAAGNVSLFATVPSPNYVSAAPDGTLFVSSGNLQVYRIPQNGTPSVIANTTNGYYSYVAGTAAAGDNGPALQATFNQINGLAYAPDGSLYIADGGRIRRIGTDGVITTIAGTQSNNSNTNTELTGVLALAVANDGTIFFRTTPDGYIRKLTTAGLMSTIAGIGNTPSCSPAPALSTSIGYGSTIAVASDGSIYIDGNDGKVIRRISSDGVLTTAAGLCDVGYPTYSGDGGPAVGPTIGRAEFGLAVDPTGTKLYLSDQGPSNQGVRMVSVIAAQSLNVPSRDGSELYVFDLHGKHQKTLDARTGGTKYSFGYDSNGLLQTVTELGVRTTTITQGAPITITGPYGHVTQLGRDPTTQFSSYVANPNNAEQYTFGTDLHGLMNNFTDPKGQKHVFEYDSIGRLTRDENPAAGVQTLQRSTSVTPGPALTETVTRTTKLLRSTTYSGQHPGVTESRTTTLPTGLQNTLTIGADGTRDWLYADGTKIHREISTDPRFALTAPVIKKYDITAAGVTFDAQTTLRSATCAAAGVCSGGTTCDGNNFTNLVTQTDSVAVNGKSFQAAYAQLCPAATGGTYAITNTTPSTTSQRYRKLTYNNVGQVTQMESGGLYPLRLHYDSKGRVDQIAQGTANGADERILTLAYNGTINGSGSGMLSTETFNDLGSDVVQFPSAGYDLDGRAKTVTPPGVSSVAMAYDLNGNVSSLTPPSGSAHSFVYDGADKMATYSPPLLGSTATPSAVIYDPDQLPIEVGRPDGDSVFIAYDPSGRVSTVNHALTSYTYGYDPSGRLSLIQTTSATTQENIQYGYYGGSNGGSVALDIIRSGVVNGTVHRDLNSFFQKSTETINSANSISFGYDDDGLLVTAGAMQLIPSTLSGLLNGTTLGCISDSYSYLHSGQSLSFGETATYGASSATCSSNQNSSLVSITYDTAANPRDKRGRVTQKQETINGTTHTFVYSYDTANRLVSVQRDGSVAESYTYDANGNRLTAPNSLNPSSQTSSSATYDAQDRLSTYPLPAPAGTNNYRTYVYSLAGERTQKHVHSDWVNHVPPIYSDSLTQYTYDAFGNLLTVILPTNDRIDYIVDGENRRVGKMVNGLLVQGLLYGSGLGPVAELNPDGSIRTRFVYGTHANVPDYMVQGTNTYRIITDQLGSVRLVVNTATGVVAQQLDYDSFGNVISATPAYPSLTVAVQPFGFGGGLYDSDTKLVRFGARDYDPEVGRWLSKDPAGFFGGSTNLFEYSDNDPINRRDPSGLTVYFESSELQGWWTSAKAANPKAAAMLQALEDDKFVDVEISTHPMNTTEEEMIGLNGAAFFNSWNYQCTALRNYRIVVDPATAPGLYKKVTKQDMDFPAALTHEAAHVSGSLAGADPNDEINSNYMENLVRVGRGLPKR